MAKLDHVGLLTDELDVATATYRAIGCELVGGVDNVRYLRAGTDVLIELMGPPYPKESEAWVQGHGASIERVAFAVDDVSATPAGATRLWSPRDFAVDGVTLATTAGYQTPDGLTVDLVLLTEHAPARPASDSTLRLHHVCHLTGDLNASTRYWEEAFGLSVVYDFTKANAGFVMLADSDWSPHHNFLLEIIGGEHDSIDGPVWEARGACYDHLCFTTDDVVGTWQKAVDRGVFPLAEPQFYPEYESTIAWLYDADGNHIELMDPIPDEMVADALSNGCSSQWVDDWKRDVAVIPYPGHKPEIRL